MDRKFRCKNFNVPTLLLCVGGFFIFRNNGFLEIRLHAFFFRLGWFKYYEDACLIVQN